MIKKLLLFILIIFTNYSVSQEKKKLIIGKIKDSLGVVKNANIINLKTKQGTFSSNNGVFRIFASKGDTIRISSVQHHPKKILINTKIINNKKLEINLNTITYTLDSFVLKKHNLKGSLSLDVKKVPRNKKDSLLRDLMDFSNINFKNFNFPFDAIDKMKPPVVNTVPNSFSGAGASVKIPFKDSERLWALRRKLAQKKAFPYKILSELGEKFFFDTLKIPVDKYFHFLEYCNPLGIENLHKEGKLLEVIKILRRESISYRKIIKK